MPTLPKDLRGKLDKAILAAREEAEKGARAALEALGVGDAKRPSHLDADGESLRRRLRARGRQAGDVRKPDESQGIEHLVQECAYEHWHRMLFARFLAENELLIHPEMGVAVSLEECEDLARDEGLDLWELASRFAQHMLPQVFRQDDPVLNLRLPTEARIELNRILNDLPPDVFTASDSLGWTYQFWQTKRKKEVNESGVKIGADELSPVTQLFTEDYMVDFLLDNTLGAWRAGKVLAANPKLAEGAQSEDQLRQAIALPGCAWNYLRFIQGEDGRWAPASGTFDSWPKTAQELTCLDPCMGSGHLLVAIFERLVALRQSEEKLDEAAAVALVIRDNLFGLEIDPRCTQIGAFNLALAAWRRVGHCKLPAMNVACSGLAPNTREADWLAIAGDDQKLQRGMERLYRLFQKAAVLGSLINPRAGEGDLLVAAFHELQPLLEKALAQEAKDDTAHEMAVTARGLAKAAEILASQFTLVTTNVPYLKSGNQVETLKEFCKANFFEAKSDLATCFIERCLGFCLSTGSTALVTPQSWLYQPAYASMRRRLLEDFQWNYLAKLGPRAFETISGEVVNVSLVCISAHSSHSGRLVGIDASEEATALEKANGLKQLPMLLVEQRDQLRNPEQRVVISGASEGKLLTALAQSYKGITSNDDPQFFQFFWEQDAVENGWEFLQSTVKVTQQNGGLESIVLYENGCGRLRAFAAAQDRDRRQDFRGVHAWGKPGVTVSCTGSLPVSFYSGHKFDTNAAVIVPNDPQDLAAIWTFCSSSKFNEEVRKIDQSLKVTNATLVKIPFDLAHWQRMAAAKFPAGLPKPFSRDPTQWLFNGNPSGSDQPLHVAVARLLGYQWPRQTGSSFPECPALGPDGLENLADGDGIVCLTSLRGEANAADRLRAMLSAALGKVDEHQLIATAGKKGSKSNNLGDWLRDEFFEQHCDLFYQHPFLWHIWDGRKDGFHALVNYHKLVAPNGAGRRTLESLTHGYLGDWITRQKHAKDSGEEGADDRHAAAVELQNELKSIVTGEPPYDLFIRWKPLHRQPIGWEPDLNDGIRLNARPFLTAKLSRGKKDAGVFRFKPNIGWEKDRGKEPLRSQEDFPWLWKDDVFVGHRLNDIHLKNSVKEAARQRQPKSA